jgi:AraC-like DNA-binding protein/mannose-6-phosphate isomerase-like protein (cupin superfamily)
MVNVFVKLSELRRLTESLRNNTQPLSQAELAAAFEAAVGVSPDRLYQEMEMDARFVNTHEDYTADTSASQLHSHTFYEILYVHGGSIQYILGSERYRVQHGDVVFVPPGVSHCPLFGDASPEPYRRYVMWLSMEFAELVTEYFPELSLQGRKAGLLRTAGTPWEEHLREDFRRGVQEAARQGSGWQAAVCGNTLQLMNHLQRAARDLRGAGPQTEKHELLDEVLAYIEAHLGEKITLADTARHFLVSESTISQLFRNRMDSSFYRCVTRRRLIAAKSLILNDEPLESIYSRVGFGDYSTFYRAFKREYGISPRQFHQLQQQPLGENRAQG